MTHPKLPDTCEGLRALITQAQVELGRLAQAQDPDIWTRIKGQEACKRAIIVAAVQRHPMLFVGPPKTSKSMLVQAATQLEVAATGICLPVDDIDNRKAWAALLKKHKTAIAGAYIYSEVPAVPTRTLLNPQHGTTLARALEHVASARNIVDTLPTDNPTSILDENCKALLRQAMTELGITAKSLNVILQVSLSIAALDGNPKVQVQHVAEAIQYAPERIRAGD